MAVLYPEFPPIAFLAALLLLLPLPWHWRAGNIATLSIIAWLFTSNVIYGVNAAVWGDNVRIVGMVWCDISTKLIIGANFALPVACLCLCIHLEQVSSPRMKIPTLRAKQRRQWFEAILCIGLPLLFMALHTIVQGHRYDIIQGHGCRPTTYFSIPAIFIVWLPPIVIAIACLILSAFSLRNFLIRRITFAADLKKTNSGFTTSRYLRLISMAITQMVWAIGVTSYALCVTTVGLPLRPWTTWADVHSDFNRVDVLDAALTPKNLQSASYALWWMVPASTVLFVTFFSFGQDAMDEYKKCITWVKENIFRVKPSDGKEKRRKKIKDLSFVNPAFLSSTSKPVLPVISQTMIRPDVSLDYSHTLYQTASSNRTFGSMSSTDKTDSTLQGTDRGHSRSGSGNGMEVRYESKQYRSQSQFTDNFPGSPTRNSFRFQEPRAIGSYSDLSIYSPSAHVVSPCSTFIDQRDSPSREVQEDEFTTPRSSFTDALAVLHRDEADLRQEERQAPSTPSIAIPDPTHESVIAPTGSRRRPLLLFGSWQGSRRPTTYPSYEAEIRSMKGAPEGPP